MFARDRGERIARENPTEHIKFVESVGNIGGKWVRNTDGDTIVLPSFLRHRRVHMFIHIVSHSDFFFLSHTYTYEYMSRVHLTRRSRVLVLTTPAHPAFAGPHRKGVQVLWVLGLVLVEAPNHGRRNHPPPELPCLPCLVCTHWVYVRTYLFISVFSHNCYEYVRCDVD